MRNRPSARRCCNSGLLTTGLALALTAALAVGGALAADGVPTLGAGAQPRAEKDVPSADAAAPLSFEAALARFHERADILRAQEADVARAEHAADAAKWLGGPKVDVAAMHLE